MTNKRITIIDGHPDPDRGRFIHALSDSYGAGAEAAGHEVRRIDIANLHFGLISTRSDWETGSPPKDIADAQDVIAWADHMVILYPLWLGDVPALLKGFFEQALRPGFAFQPHKGSLPEKRLAGRTAHIVVTMGMPAIFYRFFFGAHSVRSLERNILNFVGIKPVSRSLIGNIETNAAHRDKWLRTMNERGAAAH
ncbi:NAD(P)H-dependent oxidoreductase [Sphingopyxis fribergensis]